MQSQIQNIPVRKKLFPSLEFETVWPCYTFRGYMVQKTRFRLADLLTQGKGVLWQVASLVIIVLKSIFFWRIKDAWTNTSNMFLPKKKCFGSLKKNNKKTTDKDQNRCWAVENYCLILFPFSLKVASDVKRQINISCATLCYISVCYLKVVLLN